MASPKGAGFLSNYYELLSPENFPQHNLKKKKRPEVFTGGNEGKFMILRHTTEGENLCKLSPFFIKKALDIISRDLKSVNVNRKTGTILIETKNNKQAEALLKITQLGMTGTSPCIPVKCELHPFLNTSRGVIYSRDLLDDSDEIILDGLKGQNVIEVKRIKKINEGKLINTPLMILTFNTTIIPEYVNAGYVVVPVKLYIPNPMRCKRCQGLGHTKNWCKKEPVCVICAAIEPDHPNEKECKAPIKCINCKGNHEAFRKMCPKYKDEVQIIKIKTVDRISYPEAKRKFFETVNTIFNNSSVPTFSEVTKRNIPQASTSKSTSDSNKTIQKNNASTSQLTKPTNIINTTDLSILKNNESTKPINMNNTTNQSIQKNKITTLKSITPSSMNNTTNQNVPKNFRETINKTSNENINVNNIIKMNHTETYNNNQLANVEDFDMEFNPSQSNVLDQLGEATEILYGDHFDNVVIFGSNN